VVEFKKKRLSGLHNKLAVRLLLGVAF